MLWWWIALGAVAAVSDAPADWQTFPGGRAMRLSIDNSNRIGFTEVPSSISGVRFTNHLSDERSLTNQVFLNGSGVAAGDVDGDGLCDLYLCGLEAPNALYRNLGGWRFEEIATKAGVACGNQASTGTALVDMDGDGDLDLLVNGIARGTRLFLNDGRGKFQEVTDASGLKNPSGSSSLAMADVDGDGLPDLYVVNYRSDTMRDMPDQRFRFAVTNGISQLLSVNGKAATAPELVGRYSFNDSGGVLENGEPDTLYHNDGKGRFTAVSWTDGAFLDENGAPVRRPYDWGLSAMFRDLNGDGAPDLYVCNDFQSPDRCWINDGRGRFRAVARPAIRQTSLFSMGIDFADFDRDGFVDFFVADMLSRDHARRHVQVLAPAAFAQVRSMLEERPQFSRNTLFRNRGDGTFAELAQYSSVQASEWSWCPVFLDVDLDGYEDLLITTGHGRDAQNADIARELETERRRRPMSALEELGLRRRFPRLDTPNVAFRNRRDLTFEDRGAAWGFDSRRISHGMALADLDLDGDLDVIINCLNDSPLLLRNEAGPARVGVRLRGLAPNTRGVGAAIRVVAPGLPPQTQEMIAGGRYLSSDDFMRTFAAGSPTNRVTIEVNWRSGRNSIVADVEANWFYEIDESVAPIASTIRKANADTVRAPGPFFADLSALLNHRHVDEPFDDFARQPLIPRKVSQLGPGVAWFDFNGDGWDDLFIGAGKGGRLAVFRNDRAGAFVPQRAKAFESPLEADLTAVLAWRLTAEASTLLLGMASYEGPGTNAPVLRRFSMNSGEFENGLLRSRSSTGPMAMADWDGDGDLDLFVGGRVVPGRYPEPPASWLLRNREGRLELDTEASRSVTGAGMVSGAVFTDLDLDGWPDLVLACDWGPIRVLHNAQGKFIATNLPVRWGAGVEPGARSSKLDTTDSLTGWWNSVAVGDFDNDGRMDLIAGNWGRNHAQNAFLQAPLDMYFGDVPGADGFAVLEVHNDPGIREPVPVRDLMILGQAFPLLHDHFQSFAAFSGARLADLQKAGFANLGRITATLLDSLILLNRANYFEAHRLPAEAQMSPAFGLVIGDFDGDGSEDVFLAQNFFGVTAAESRMDAGKGLWLRGDGSGGLTAVPAAESGFAIMEEGRGAAQCDFDHDGRTDLVVGQNHGPTKLYRNLRARPGIRLRLLGGPGNLQAVGARVRVIERSGRSGPAHEVHLGGGYWSQNSGEMVLSASDDVEALEIRWPNGVRERVALAPAVRELSRSQPSGGEGK